MKLPRAPGRLTLVLLLLCTLAFISFIWQRSHRYQQDAALHARILEVFKLLHVASDAAKAEALRVHNGLVPHYDMMGRAQRERSRLLQELRRMLAQERHGQFDWLPIWQLAQGEAAAHDALLEDFKTLHAPLRNTLMVLPVEIRALLEDANAHDREHGGDLHHLLDGPADRLLVATLLLMQNRHEESLHETTRLAAQLNGVASQLPPSLQERIRLIVLHTQLLGEYLGRVGQLLDAATQHHHGEALSQLRASWLAMLAAENAARETENQVAYALALLLLAAFAAVFIGLRRSLEDIARARETMAAQSALSRTVFDSSHDGIIVTDDRGLIQAANPGIERMFGWLAGELLGRSVNDLMPREHAMAHDEHMRRYRDSGVAHILGKPFRQFQGRRRDGTEFDLDIVVTEAAASSGGRRFVGVIRDVSQRLRVERAIAALATAGSGQTFTDSGRLAGNEAFYQKCVQALAEAFGADYAFIGEFTQGAEQARTRAFWSLGQQLPTLEYALAGTPCENLLHEPRHLVASGLRNRYPTVAMLGQLGADSYFGVALLSSGGAHLGQLAVMSRKPLRAESWMRSVLDVYAARIGLELQRERSERALYESREQALVTLQSIGDAVVTTDAQACVTYLNPVAEQLSGWKDHEARGQPLIEVLSLLHELTHEPAACPATACLASGNVVHLSGQTLLVRRDGEEFPIEDSAAPIRAPGGAVTGVVMVFRDVSEERSLRQRLDHQATHDALTGLINRTEFERRVLEALAASVEHGAEHALLYLDLDQFKVVNDTCGHMAGDELLRQICAVLSHVVRESDTLARLGGDEFGVLLPNCPLPQATRIAEKLRAAVAAWVFQWSERSFQVGASIGVVPVTRATETYAALLADADLACYAAKEQGRNRVHVRAEGETHTGKRRGEMFWAGKVREALARPDGLTLFRQPVYAIQDDSRLAHHEVLVRLPNGGGILDPAQFLPAAERYGLMPQLDRHVVRLALEHLRQQPPGTVYAINLSGQALSEESLLPFLTQTIEASGVKPRHVCFEITETTAITSLTHTSQLMRALRRLGCRFALDDFGSGFSSYVYLKQLPVDFLKIDGQFVRDISRDPLDRAIVQSAHQIAHAMGIRTIAEGVEDEATLGILRDIGVDFAQGYFFSPPRPLPPLDS
jgi:diguanylate cyclase (GGDEF)-like protein/PAS domain S-box-containing protein